MPYLDFPTVRLVRRRHWIKIYTEERKSYFMNTSVLIEEKSYLRCKKRMLRRSKQWWVVSHEHNEGHIASDTITSLVLPTISMISSLGRPYHIRYKQKHITLTMYGRR